MTATDAGGPAPLPFEPAPPPGDAGALLERARAEGFLYLPRLVPAERLDLLRTVIDGALARRGWRVEGRTDPALRLGRWDDARWVELLGEVVASPAFRGLAAAPEILEVIRLLVGGEPALHVGDVCRLVSPGAVDLTTPAHQDAGYLKDAAGVWTVWLPIEPCPLALGPLAVLPASHLGGVLPHAAAVPDGPQVGVDVPAGARWRTGALEVGDAIFFSSFTVHKAMPNLTADRLRISVDYRYRLAA